MSTYYQYFQNFYSKYINKKDFVLNYPTQKVIKGKKFDRVIIPNLIGKSSDLQPEFEKLRKAIRMDGLLILSSINPIWGRVFGYKNPKTPLIFLWFMKNLLDITGFEVIKSGYLVIPPQIPILSSILNSTLTKIPKIKRLLPFQFVIAKPKKVLPLKNFSVSVIIPTFNEEDNIADCINQVPKIGNKTEIIICDDGSTDKTLLIAKTFLNKYHNLKVLSLPHKGKAWAVKEGFKKAKGDILMIWDADRTVPPSELPRFYKLLASNQAEYAQGTRLTYPMEKQAMRSLNLIGNFFFGWLYTFILNTQITDTLCGTKVIFKKDFKKIKFPTEPWGDFDLLFGAKKLGLKIKEVPVHYRARIKGLSKMKTFKYGLVVAKMSLKAFWEFKIKNLSTSNFPLFVILLLALIVRFMGLIPNLPYHPDEGAIQQTSHKLFLSIITKGDFEPDSYKYGSIVFYIQAIIYLPFLIIAFLLKLLSFLHTDLSFANKTFIDYFLGIIHDFRETLFWAQRASTALFGVLSVLLTYLISKKLFSKPVGLISALIFAISPTHVRNSHWITTDILSLFTILLALLCMVNIIKTNKLKWYIFAGVAIGISSSVRYFPIAILSYPVAALMTRNKNRTWVLKILTGLILIPIGFIISTPYLLFSSNSQAIFQKEMEVLLSFYGNTLSTYVVNFAGFILNMGKTPFPDILTLRPTKFLPFYSRSLVEDFGLAPIIASLVGLFITLIKFPKQFLIIFIIPFFNWFYISFYIHAAYDRLIIPILPFLCIYIGVLAIFIWNILAKRFPNFFSFTIVTILLLAITYHSFKESFSSSVDCSKPTVFKEAELWIDKNIPIDAHIAHIPIFMFPSKPYSSLRETQPNNMFFPEELRSENYEYMLINSSRFGYNLYPFYTDFLIRPENMYQNNYIPLALNNYKTETEEKIVVKRAKFCDPTELMIYKIPDLDETTPNLIKKFEFNNREDLNFWHIQKFNEKNKINVAINKDEFHTGSGSLEISWSSVAYMGPRVYSEKIPVQPNKYYSLVGWIKSSAILLPTERDGFLRVDFYKNNQDTELPGKSVILSKRIFGNSDWNKILLTGRSSADSSFAIISAQVNGTKASGSFYFDDIEFFSE